MSFDEGFVRKLERLLRRECSLYKDYLEILGRERTGITSFKSDKIEQAAVKRKLLTDALRESHERRVELLSLIPDSAGRKLTELIEENASPKQKKILMKAAIELRDLAKKAQVEGSSLAQVVQFALNTVNGSMSIFSQASQNVSRQYGRAGKIAESFNPKRSRNETVLKQA